MVKTPGRIGRNEVRTCGVRTVSLVAQHKLRPHDAAPVFPYLYHRESRLQSRAEDLWTMKTWKGVVIAVRKEKENAVGGAQEDVEDEETILSYHPPLAATLVEEHPAFRTCLLAIAEPDSNEP